MEILVGLVALVAGAAALALVFDLRGRVRNLESALATGRQLNTDMQSAHEAVHAEMGELRRELDRALRELGELKTAAEAVPAPPLPKARPGGLDDLREQLRAAHREPDDTEDV
jgi:hypothetical protein